MPRLTSTEEAAIDTKHTDWLLRAVTHQYSLQVTKRVRPQQVIQ